MTLAISIHAPTRGATGVSEKKVIHRRISIHAPTRGATAAERVRAGTLTNFNPRSYKRSDGASNGGAGALYLFQSTLLQEERLDFFFTNKETISFQSTLLQEERRLTPLHQ